MRTTGWERWGAYSGIVAAVLFVIGFGLVTSASPSSSDSDQQIIAFYTENGHKAAGIGGAYIIAIAGLLFLVFLTALRRAMEDGRPAAIGAGQYAFVCGVLFVAMLFVFCALSAAVPAALALDTVDEVDPAIVRFLPQAGFGALLVFGAFAAVGMIVCTSVYSLQTGFLPHWHAWLGFLAALALVFAAAFVPIIALPIWLVATGIVLLGRRAAELSAMIQAPTVHPAAPTVSQPIVEPITQQAELPASETDGIEAAPAAPTPRRARSTSTPPQSEA